MFWLQVLKKINQPIVFIIFSSVFILLITFTNHLSYGQIIVENDNSRAGKMTIPLKPSSGSGEEGLSGGPGGDDMFFGTQGNLLNQHQSIEGDLLNGPADTMKVQLLPFCSPKRGGHDGAAAGDLGEEHNTSSDEIVLSSKDKFGEGKRIVVATLDGQLAYLNENGKVLWSFCSGNIFSSTISSLQLRENGKMIHLIPSLTGGLYKYDGDNLKPVPLNADLLLKKSFKLANDVVITGGKELKTFGIELNSGDLRYECGISGCSTPQRADTSEINSKDDLVLVVKKQMQTVRAIDSLTGEERWNFSVGTHELALAGVTEGCYENEEKDTGTTSEFLRMSIPDGIIYGGDAENKRIWQYKFESPIAQAWVLENGKLISIDPIKNSPLGKNPPALYIGIYKNSQLYVQESHTTMDKIERAIEIAEASKVKPLSPLDPLKIGWKPSQDSQLNNENTALAHFHEIYTLTPNFKGVYIYEKDELKLPAIESTSTNASINDNIDFDDSEKREAESDDWDFDTSYDNDSDIENSFEEEGTIQIIFVSLWFWWKEVLGISLLTAVLTNILLMRPLMRVVRLQTVQEMLAVFRNFRNREVENNQRVRGRRESANSNQALLPLPVPNSYSSSNNRMRSVSSSSSQLGDENFTSQFFNEFEPIQCLGKGGFGVVIEAKKKIDDRHYAVKRIPLPIQKKSRDRVMREVKALAKLDHKNIVRYFNAWLEQPPRYWLEQNENHPFWNYRNIDSPSCTYNYGSPSDMYSQSHSIEQVEIKSSKKRDHFEISVQDKTPIDDEKQDDSFIVFEEYEENERESLLNASSDHFIYKTEIQQTTTSIITSENNISIMSSEYSNSNSNSTRGFFVRPTSLELDIPSSIEQSKDDENKIVLEDVEENDEEESDENKKESVTYLYIQQELCQKKTLKDWLRENKSRDLRIILKFFLEIAEAVEYIHTNNLIHRDLKPSNIFLAETNFDGGIILKIGDFGLATTQLKEIEKEKGMTPTVPSINITGQNLTGQVGTYLYMSPEQYKRKSYDYKVDIYSLGLIFFELLEPFSTEMERIDKLTKVRKLSFPQCFTAKYNDEHKLIQQMLSHDPSRRPDSQDLKYWAKSRKFPLPHSFSYPCDNGGGDNDNISSEENLKFKTTFGSENTLNSSKKLKTRVKPKHLKSNSYM